MTNLPISASVPQAAASIPNANAAESGDAQGSQPFGEVLARQISDPAVKDAKAGDKLAVDALAQLGSDADAGKADVADGKQDDVQAIDNSTTLPADMLAALLPQAMNSVSAKTANASASNAKSGGDTIDAGTATDKRGIASPKVEFSAAGASANAGTDAVANTRTETLPGTPAMQPAFAAALSASANRAASAVPAADPNAAVRVAVADAMPLVTQPQPNAAALASLQNTAAGIAAPAMQPVQMTVNTPVSQDKWADEFSQKITWLASSSQNQTAELHLNPPQLGPLDVVIKVSGDQATALFTSPHAAVREAVEQAMPRLRDMLADNGIMLGNASVSDQAPREQNQTGAQRAAASGNDIRETPATGNTTARVSPISRHNGIVDTFA